MPQIHKEPSPFRHTTVKIKTNGILHGCDSTEQDYQVEDWYDRVNGMSWMDSAGNLACIIYAIRMLMMRDVDMSFSNEVLYGKVNGLGNLVHVSEII